MLSALIPAMLRQVVPHLRPFTIPPIGLLVTMESLDNMSVDQSVSASLPTLTHVFLFLLLPFFVPLCFISLFLALSLSIFFEPTPLSRYRLMHFLRV